jgi:hypothetical protein
MRLWRDASTHIGGICGVGAKTAPLRIASQPFDFEL